MSEMQDGLHKVQFNPDDDCNVPDGVILDQVRLNICRQLPQVWPHAPNNEIVALVCGGPSLKDTERDLVDLYWSGAKIVAVNGAYQWCIDRNIKPSAMVMLDARAFNARFVANAVLGCRYLLAAQCHPQAFELCKDREVTLWHCCSAGQAEFDLLSDYYFKRFHPITLGTTVSIRAIQLLCMLGFRTFDIFGLDSCWLDDRHHSYQQAENNEDYRRVAWLRPPGREDLWCRFTCAPWMMRQAMDFENLIRQYGNEFRLNVRGNGLIAAIMRISAELGSVTIEEGT
jgi:Protein of unknown function DUF115